MERPGSRDGLPRGVPVIIRPETGTDLPAIDRIHREAFRDHPHSRQTEHCIVRALRASGALSLSLVAEGEGRVVGHVAFSPARINGEDLGWFTLGPVAVLPSRQGQGIGSSLVQAGLQGLRAGGANGCLLVGDPGYYARFGFKPFLSLSMPEVPPAYFIGIAFKGDRPGGLATPHPAFSATDALARTPSTRFESTLTCPLCGVSTPETMAADACRWFYRCPGCGRTLRPKPGDCCVFCSYGSVPCPPVQLRGNPGGSCCGGA